MSDIKAKDTTAQNIKDFIEEHDGSWQEGWRCMSGNLVKELIAQLGGETKFIEVYQEIADATESTIQDTVGFNTNAKLLGFYDAHKSEILAHADNCANRTDTSSVLAMLNIQFSDNDISEDDIEKALDESPSPIEDTSHHRIEVCGWLVECAVYDLCINYVKFLEDLDY